MAERLAIATGSSIVPALDASAASLRVLHLVMAERDPQPRDRTSGPRCSEDVTPPGAETGP
ncbi:MAG: hypothetical protein HY296_01000 [Thaumarchaeota archaeon]|nr:hypothetical protein [Nitrososphaerota archaeon]